MTDEIQLISDGAGLAVIGETAAVERFLASERLPSRDLGLPRLQKVLSTSAAGAQAGSQMASGSGRWVQLTKDSAELVHKYGLMPTKTSGVSHAMIGKPGDIKKWIQIAKGPGSLTPSPALLSGAAGIMTQLAMQQAMDEIGDYLKIIDEKLDDVLRAQKDAVLADMVGADFVIEEAMTIRQHAGRVSEVTWSKVQTTSLTIAKTQAYALRQLDALAEKVERKAKIGELADAAEDAAAKVHEWLAVLAHCFRLQDAISVLELDRVLDAAPDQLDQHRTGLRVARQQRLDLISRSTGRLMERLDVAAGTANSKVLLHPTKAPVVVRSSNHVASAIVELDEHLGIDRGRDAVAARRWVEAALDVKDRAVMTGASGVEAALRQGTETLDTARSATEAALGAGASGVDAAKKRSIEAVDRATSLRDKLSAKLADGARQSRTGKKDSAQDG